MGILTFGINEYLSLDALRANEAVLRQAVADNFLLSLTIFVGVYIAVVTTYIPGASILTLTGGFLFGTWIGAGATVVGATIGALGAYALIRTAIGEPLRRKAEASGGLLKRLIDGFGGNAFSYVLSLRLVPAAPFWLVNAAAGVGSAPMRPYALASRREAGSPSPARPSRTAWATCGRSSTSATPAWWARVRSSSPSSPARARRRCAPSTGCSCSGAPRASPTWPPSFPTASTSSTTAS